MKAKCVICGAEFEQIRKNHACCSEKCRKKLEKQKKSEWGIINKQNKKKEERVAEAEKVGKELTDIQIKAEAAGMSYGQYVARMGL